MITEFSPEVCEKLGYYVYRLVDPRNNETFYVGKGTDNRIFHHAKDIVPSSNYKNKTKKRISEIKNAGFDVIQVIQRWGMDEQTAFAVEAALIDYIGVENLTNSVKGHDTDKGMIDAEELEIQHAAKQFEDYPECVHKFILIKITDYSINLNGGNIYEAVRKSWKINPNIANNYPYVLAVKNGIVRGVYQINRWEKTKDGKRAEFTGKDAPEEIQQIFLKKKIPDRFGVKGSQNPLRYCDRNQEPTKQGNDADASGI